MKLNKYYNLPFERSSDFIDDGSVDMFFCDPPYYISGDEKIDKDLNFGDRYDWDRQWNSPFEYYEWNRKWMEMAYRQLKDTGSIYVCSVWEHSGKIQESLEDSGFKIINRITWKRDKGRGSKKNWKSMHEDIWFAVKNEKKYKFYVDRVMVEKEVVAPYRDEKGNPKDWKEVNGKKIRYTHPGNIWDEFTVPFWSMKEVRSYAKTKRTPENTLTKHNTQKPKDLVKKCIIASTDEGDLIVDYFFGSGTTPISAIETGRNYISFDINKVCVEMLETRLEKEI